MASGTFARYLAEDLYERCLFVKSGVLATDSRLTNITGTRIEMPFFDIFDPTEEVIDSLGYLGRQRSWLLHLPTHHG